MRFKNEASGTWTNYESYATAKPWSLSNSQGTRYVYVQFKDAAGNETTGSTNDTIIFDSIAPPEPNLTSPGDGANTSDTTPGFTWSSVSGAVSYQIEIDDLVTFASPNVTATVTTPTYTTTTLTEGTWFWRV